MPYRPVAYDHVPDALKEIFERADMFLRDVYGMFALPPESLPSAGGGNWSIALVLLCVVDGISVHVYPTSALLPNQEQRFKRLINNKLYWGPPTKRWYAKHNAAAVFYTELRNPLVHELAIDRPAPARFRAGIEKESAIVKWDPVQRQDIDAIDAMTTWNDDWPTLSVADHDGGKRLKLSCAALYWTVKQMVNALAADNSVLNAAAALCNQPKPPKSLLKHLCELLRR